MPEQMYLEKRNEDQKSKDCLKTLEQLAKLRKPYEQMIDNILEYVFHGRRRIREKDTQKGQKTGIDIYDGTALGALNLLADGLHGYLVAPSLRWFNFQLPGKLNFPRASGMRAWSGKQLDEYPEVKRWLEDCEEVMYSAFLRSNFYDITPEFFRDGASIGTATCIVEEDIAHGRIIFQVPHFRECYIAENRFLQVDTNYREFKYTARQLLDKWNLDTLKEAIPEFETRYDKDKYEEFELVHGIYPRKDYDADKLDSKNMPFESVWVLKSPRKLLDESGYRDLPAITWRWRKNNDELYGRSPAWDAYIDIMTANQQGKTNLIAGNKMAEPPMVGPSDLRGKVRTGPRGWTWVTDMQKQMPRPLNEGINLPFAIEAQNRTDQKIREHFHVDFFLMLSQAAFQKTQLTATQVLEMGGEKAAILGTRIGRLQSEFLNPVIDRVFDIETQAGRIPEAPEILMAYAQGPIEVDYLGPLAQAQKRLFRAQGIGSGLQAMALLAEIFPESRDIIDPDITTRELLESKGFPAKCTRDDDAVRQIRQIRGQRQQEMEALQEGIQVAKAMPAAGKAIEKGSAMDLLLGGGGE